MSFWNFIKPERIKKIKNMDKRQRILIVDDAKLNRDINPILLKRAEYDRW